MKKLVLALAVASSAAGILPAASFAQQSSDQPPPGSLLTGDVALACEAILCLSSGTRPNECAASLSRYFGISLKYWSDTVTARRNFLSLCPAAQNTSSANMPALVDAIANGAGQCDPASLNRNIIYVPKQVCEGSGWERSCTTTMVAVVNPQEPSYCIAYTTNANTYQLGVTYVGEPLNGGHWVNATTGQ